MESDILRDTSFNRTKQNCTPPLLPLIPSQDRNLLSNGQLFSAAASSNVVEGPAIPVSDGHIQYQGNCLNCKKNWDLLNRNQGADLSCSSSSREESSSVLNNSRTADSSPACLSFDLDGLLPSVDKLQVRLDQILAAKEVKTNFQMYLSMDKLIKLKYVLYIRRNWRLFVEN